MSERKTEQTPRIDLQTGDTVEYPTIGQAVVVRTYEGHGGRLVAEVDPAGWSWDSENECWTTENTGNRGALPIRAADLRRGEG